MKVLILSDFDGTITTKDTLVELLDIYAYPKWHAIAGLVARGKMGTRVALRKEFSLFYLPKNQYLSFLRKKIKIDPYFKSFVKFIRNKGARLVILSGGFSLNISQTLKKYKLGKMLFYANKLLFKNGKFEIVYTHPGNGCRQCGNCKKDRLLQFKKKGYYIVYIGDSVTDHCPVREADLVFAKWNLEIYCRKRKIPYILYVGRNDIKNYLSKNLLTK